MTTHPGAAGKDCTPGLEEAAYRALLWLWRAGPLEQVVMNKQNPNLLTDLDESCREKIITHIIYKKGSVSSIHNILH